MAGARRRNYERGPDWTPEEDQYLVELRQEKPALTFFRISAMILAKFGTTRTKTACGARYTRLFDASKRAALSEEHDLAQWVRRPRGSKCSGIKVIEEIAKKARAVDRHYKGSFDL